MRVVSNSDLQECTEVLNSGGIVCYPTETFYGLGIDPWNEQAREKLYALKGRMLDKQLPMIASSIEMVSRFFDTTHRDFKILASRFWPGPLTLILPTIEQSFIPNGAVRVSSHSTAQSLSESFGKPIVSTSANQSGEPPIANPRDLSAQLVAGIDILLDGGICAGGCPSTILSLLEKRPMMVREGAISAAEILALI
ncbi:MAG: threonylcarbamoyl-AMP synthase [Acidobacteria bacterium]|nr:MAG: threonylcarbamoyl-AMP synthase [Acidobacteriota bacterium]